jgi:glycine cleavage system transcriptional repressor
MERYSPPRNNTQLCAISMSIGVPAQLMLVNLRNEFMDLCDELNLDAVMGPLK